MSEEMKLGMTDGQLDADIETAYETQWWEQVIKLQQEKIHRLQFKLARTPDLSLLREAFEAGQESIDRFGATISDFDTWAKDKGLAEG